MWLVLLHVVLGSGSGFGWSEGGGEAQRRGVGLCIGNCAHRPRGISVGVRSVFLWCGDR
jgi:hypothetical protein